MYEYKPARFRRFLAWILDWVVCGLIPWCLVGIPDLLGVSSFSLAPLGIAAALGFFASFLCRDYLLGGRSIGKRLLGLTVVDRQTGEVLTGGKLVKAYQVAFVLVVVIGATLELELVWNIADTLNGFMAVPNLIALLGLSGVVIKLTKDHFEK